MSSKIGFKLKIYKKYFLLLISGIIIGAELFNSFICNNAFCGVYDDTLGAKISLALQLGFLVAAFIFGYYLQKERRKKD
jgi:hypothetical protein